MGHFCPQHMNVLFLRNKICIMYGTLIQMLEAYVLQYITVNTSIPVPRVHCAFMHSGLTYIVMEQIHEDSVAKVWYSLLADSKERIFTQLWNMVNKMRALSAPGPGISNTVSGPLYDPRFPGRSKTIRPFQSIRDFHTFL